ncbi:MAG TPA: DUF6036 family nucleotidyltransferase [Thermodesulfobacteriota bacterium]|nr:DUF6036 family nucleotidyltransferase [Thermodesulfobacteriota bacterium]
MFEEILTKVGAELEKQSFPYMIIGGQAVLLYGEPRLTRDIDITLGADSDRLNNLLPLIQELHILPLPKDPFSFVKETMVLPCLDKSTGIRIDFIFSHSPYEAAAIARARKIRVKDQEVFFATVEDVIIHKMFAGRPRDLEDVRILCLKNKEMDLAYIEKWLKEFDLLSESAGCLETFRRLKNPKRPPS